MPSNEYDDMFAQYEKEYSLPEGYLSRTAEIESGYDPAAKNPKSSATGLFQFIKPTADEYKVDPLDPESSTDGAARLGRDNADILRKTLGREPSAGELYLAHQQGGTGAAKILSDPKVKAVDVVGEEAVKLNGGNVDMTAGEFAKLWTSKFPEAPNEHLPKMPKYVSQEELSEREADEMVFNELLKGNILGLEPEDIEDAYDAGLLTDQQVDTYIAYKEHPVWFTLDDMAGSVTKGVLEGVDGTVNALLNEPWNTLMPGTALDVGKLNISSLVMDPHTGAGNFVRIISQFAVPYTGASKAVNATNTAARMMQASRLGHLEHSAPKVYHFFKSVFGNTIAGGIADYTAFNPHDHRISDMLEEWGALPEFLEFMTTDDSDPTPIARLKGVLEGAIVGNVLDTALMGIKALKRVAFTKCGGEAEKVAAELVDNSDKLRETMETVVEREAVSADPAKSLKSGEGVTENVESGAAQGVEKSGGPLKSPVDGADAAKREAQAHRILNAMGNDSTPVFHEDLIARMEKDGGSADKFLKLLYRETDELMAKTRKSQSNRVTEAKATGELKTLAKMTGKPMEYAKKVFTDMENMTARVRTLNRFFVTYTEQTNNLVKEAMTTGDFRQKLRSLEHIKNMQELQLMVYGVRAESGRLLQHFNMKWQKGRFDFDALKLEELGPIKDAAEDQIDEVLKAFSLAKNPVDKMARARNFGRFRTMRGLLEFVQLNLLWSPATHIRNFASQSLMLGWKSLHRGIGGVMHTMTTGDIRHLHDAGHWYLGMAHGLADSFRGLPTAVKEGGSILFNKSRTFDEYMKDPRIGNFYKSLVSGDPIIDPMTKVMDTNGNVVEGSLESALKKIPVLGKPMSAIFRSPFNFLTAADDAFKTVAYNGEVYSRMYREGVKQNLKDAGMVNWMKQTGTEKMPRSIHEEATHVMRELTFQLDTEGAAKHLERAMNSSRFGLGFRILAMPFYRIMVNMLKFSKDNTVLGLTSKRVWHELSQGGVQMWETMSRIATGTSMLAVGAYLYGTGAITGRKPKDQREAWDNAGVQEYSFWTGKRWVSYASMEPLATWLAVAADLSAAWETAGLYVNGHDEVKLEDAIGAFALAITEPTVNKTFMQSTKELFTLISDYERMNVAKYGKRQLEKFVPATTLWNWHQRNLGGDEHQHTLGKNFEGVDGLLEVAYKNFDSGKLAPKRHSIYGTKVEKEPAAFMTSLNAKTPEQDPVALEMLQIGCNIKPPSDKVTMNGVEYKMSNQEYDKFQELISQLPVQGILEQAIRNPNYQGIGHDDTKAKILTRIVTNIRSAARKQFQAKNPHITQEIVAKVRRNADAILGIETLQDPTAQLYHFMELMQ